MVKYNDDRLDRIFSALSDRTRRGLLARLGSRQTMSISELAEPLDMSLPAVMKHLDVLGDAGLIKRSKNGRTVSCVLDATPMQHANEWLERYQKFWTASFDRLAQFLEDDQWHSPPKLLPRQSSPASPSNSISRPRRPRSTKPGPTRKR
jgi:DNA-binding transcriptional ArsR family regulator